MKTTFLLPVLLTLALAAPASAQELGVSGTEFVFSFPANYQDAGSPLPYIRLYFTAETRTRVRIYVGTTLKNTIYTAANELVTQDLTGSEGQAVSRDARAPVPNDQVYRNKAIRVVADDPVTVFGLNLASYTADGMAILPTSALGRRYVIASAADVTSGGTGQLLPSQFLVAAAHDSTTVTITSAWDTPNHRAGELYVVQLRKGDVFSSMSSGPGGDLSGSVIEATKPVAVMAGQSCTYIPSAQYPGCDHLEEMLLPTEAWGTAYHSIPFATRLKGDYHRIFASEPNTDVFVNGVRIAALTMAGGGEGRGWVSFLPATREALVFTANKPILVAQYNNSQNYDGVPTDPFMIGLTPVEQFRTSMELSTAEDDFSSNYLTVVGDSAGWSQIEVRRNGTIWENLAAKVGGSPRAFGGTIAGRRYVGATIDLPPGAYMLRGPAAFTAYVYGSAGYTSYGWPAGAGTAALRSPDTVAPLVAKTVDCNGAVDAHVRDLPDDAAVRSNLATIYMLPSSVNYEIDLDRFEPGVSPATRYRLTVIDRTKDARAIVSVVDRAGNATYDTTVYGAFGVIAGPSSASYGTLAIGMSADRSIMVRNTSSAPATFTEVRLAHGDRGFSIVDSIGGFTIDSGASRTIPVRFTATVSGSFIDSLVLVDACGARRIAELRAQVSAAALIQVSDRDFGAWPITAQGPKPGQIEIRNASIGGGVLIVSGVAQGFNDAVTFTLPNGLPAFPLSLASGEVRVVTVEFKPASVRRYTDSIVFVHNAPPSPQNDATGVVMGEGVITPAGVTSETIASHVAIEAIVPNPASGDRMEIHYRSSGRAAAFTLTSVEGIVLRTWSEPAGATSTRVDLSGVPAGVYYVALAAGDMRAVRPVVVVR